MLRQESAETPRPAAPDSQPQSPPPVTNPNPSAPQGPGMMGQVPAFAGMPPMQNPMWAAGSMPAPPAAPAPVAPSPDPAFAERERRLADQERRMEEQERRLADQERIFAAAAQREDVRERNDLERPAAGPLPPDPALVERERRLAEQERRLAEQERNIASAIRREDVQQRNDVARPAAEERLLESPLQADSHRGRQARGAKDELHNAWDQGEPSYDRQEEYIETAIETAVAGSQSSPGPDDRRERHIEAAVGNVVARSQSSSRPERLLPDMEDAASGPERDEVRQAGPHPGTGRGYGRGDDKDCVHSVNGNGRGSRVYKEYIDLLSETEELDAADEEKLVELPLDINLLSSLTRWTSLARSRVGEQRLKEILDLYSQSGHLSAKLRERLEQISNMVDDQESETSQDAQLWVDLIFHLHGILAGGLTIRQLVKPPSEI